MRKLLIVLGIIAALVIGANLLVARNTHEVKPVQPTLGQATRVCVLIEIGKDAERCETVRIGMLKSDVEALLGPTYGQGPTYTFDRHTITHLNYMREFPDLNPPALLEFDNDRLTSVVQ